MIHSPCPNDGTCACGCHGRTLGDPTPDWDSCCGHPLTWGLMWPDPPASLDDFPTCWCDSGQLITSFAGDFVGPQVTLYSLSCCMEWGYRRSRPRRHQSGPAGLLGGLHGGWYEAIERIGGYPAIHAINRGEQPPEPARPEIRVSDQIAQPVLF